MRTLWSGQQIQTTPTYRRSFFQLFQAILIRCNFCILPDTTREFDFQSIPFNHRKQPCQRNSMHPFSFTVALWDALVNRYFIYLSPIDGGKNDSPLFRRRIVETKKKGKEKLAFDQKSWQEDDAFLDGRASTAANTPRLIRLGWSFLSTLLRARGFVSSRVVAWLRANASRFSGVDSPPGNEWSGRQEEGSKKSIFLPLLAGRIDGGGGDAQRGRISSLVRGARDASFQPIFRSCESRIFTYFRILNWVTIFVAIFLRQIPFISLFYKTSKLWITFETLY